MKKSKREENKDKKNEGHTEGKKDTKEKVNSEGSEER